jgi:hypothetical protein
MIWTLDDLRRLLLHKSRRERWVYAFRRFLPRNLTNFGDVQ